MSTIKKLDNGKWQARIRRAGQPDVSKSFKTKSEAQQWAHQIEYSADPGAGVKKTQDKDITVSQAIASYELGAPDPDEVDLLLLRMAKHDIGSYKISSLSSVFLNRYIKMLLKTKVPPPHNKKPKTKSKTTGRCYSKSTVRKVFYAIKRALIWHSKTNSYSLPQDLFDDVDIPPGWANSLDRRITPEEEMRILESAAKRRIRSKSWVLLIRFALETAMRLQEMAFAKWSDLSSDGKCLSIPAGNCKTNKRRDVPLSSEARRIIAELSSLCPKQKDLIFWEFDGNARNISYSHRKILKAAQIEGLTFHSYRHEALSRLAEGGALSINELMSLSGHTSLVTFQRYLRFYASTTADKIDMGKEKLRRLAEASTAT